MIFSLYFILSRIKIKELCDICFHFFINFFPMNRKLCTENKRLLIFFEIIGENEVTKKRYKERLYKETVIVS